MATRRRGPTEQAKQLIGPQLTSMPGRIQEALEARGMNQKQLAERLGVSQSSITRAGAKGMALWNAIAMAKVLRVQLPWLFLGEGPRDQGPPPVAGDFIELREGVRHEQERQR